MSSKLLRRLLLAPVFLFIGLELIFWIFVRIPLEPLKRLHLSNTLPGLKQEVNLTVDPDLARYLDDRSGRKKSGTVRVLCLGGSATFGLLQNAEDTWWGQLGRQLKEKGHPVEVAAWGQDRTGIVASTPVAAALMERWKPDVVIGNFGFDDVVGQPLDYRYQPEKARGLTGPPPTAGWKQAILKVSQMARLRRWVLRRNEAASIENRIGHTDYWKESFEKMRQDVAQMPIQELPERDPAQDPKEEFLDGWRVLKELCDRQGAALIMTGEASLHDSTNNLTQQESLLTLVNNPEGPAKYLRPDPSWVEREMNRYAGAAEELAASLRVPWLNLNGRVPRDLENFFGDVILTDAGAAVVAREMLPVVEPVVAARKK